MLIEKLWQDVNMSFPERLVKIRKDKGFTQQTLADLIGMHVIQIHRYESGTSQPTLDVIKKIAIALRVSADELIFEKEERGPDEELRLLFEAVCKFSPENKKTAREVLEGLIIKNEARRWGSLS